MAEAEVDARLRPVVSGFVGFDMEWTLRTKAAHEIEALADTHSSTKQLFAYRQKRAREYADTEGGMPIDWDNAATCLFQIATETDVFIVEIRKIKGRIETEHVVKIVMGLGDNRTIFEDFGCNSRNFVDVGIMIRLAYPNPYAATSGPVSLKVCVQDVLGLVVENKEKAGKVKWDGELDNTDIEYAGLDAQAARNVYIQLLLPLRRKEQSLGRIIPDDWFMFHFIDGMPTRIAKNQNGGLCPSSYTHEINEIWDGND
ncbi:hypothetical protein B0H17DRAFT_1190122 [Mycena rosella]|uniref:3'-5' exonuclease domain-containing protein n=1 Tax=Mycena rosella TaxID=1033263 RepID=A0AAD7H2E3_MYCRO|nr:hypothetical protein B0H17DRAFT_1190122 [Mycena rosella]